MELSLENRTLEDMMDLQLNTAILEEVNNEEVTYDLALSAVEEHIRSLRYPNGRKVRSERIEFMIQVYRALFYFLDKNDGQCSPSMETIAMYIDPSLKLSTSYRDITAGKVRVWRAVNYLRDFGLIETHIYRAETNRLGEKDSKKMPNFFYELKAISEFSEFFAAIIISVTGVAKNIAIAIANVFENFNSTEDNFTNLMFKEVHGSNFYELYKCLRI